MLNWRDTVSTQRCVASLLDSTALAGVVVVDNESTGELREMRGERLDLIEVPENRGFSGGVNVGIRRALEAGADAVLVINNDAVIAAGALDLLVEALAADPELGIVAPLIVNPDGSVQSRGGRVSRWSGVARQNYSTRRIDYLSWACVLVRADVFRAVGELDERFFMYWEDVDYSLRARESGYRIGVVDDAVVSHELSASGRTAGRLLAVYYTWSMLSLGDKHGGAVWLRSRIALLALLLARVVRRDWPGARAIRRGAGATRSDQAAWRVPVIERLRDDAAKPNESGADRPFFVNGKWLSQPLTGTQRYATEISRRLVARHGRSVVIVVPADADLPAWTDGASIRRSSLTGNLFEQVALPFLTAGGFLLNLSGSSPLMKRRQAITLFDASAFRYGDTFSWAFTTWYRLLYRTARYRASHLFTISEFSRADLADVLHIDPQRLIVVPCGSEHLPAPKADRVGAIDQPYVVAIGSLTERKNLAGCLAVLARRGVRTVVVGAGGKSAVFADSAIPEDSHIIPLGRVTDEDIANLLADAVAMVFPSRYEGFGLPVVEAQRAGCPVVCSTSSSLPEAAGDGALFFDPDDPEAAADHVESLVASAELRDGMRQRGYANAERRSWDVAEGIVTEILNERR